MADGPPPAADDSVQAQPDEIEGRGRAHAPYRLRDDFNRVGRALPNFAGVIVALAVTAALLLLMGVSVGVLRGYPIGTSPLWDVGEGPHLVLAYGDAFLADHTFRAERQGIELVMFPLGASAGARAARRRQARAWTPLIAAGLMLAMLSALVWAWGQEQGWWVAPVRVCLAALTAGAGYAGAIAYPRLTATLTGAIVAPSAVGLLLWGLPASVVRDIGGGAYAALAWPAWIAGALAGLLLLAVAVIGVVEGRWPRMLMHAAWPAALMLFLSFVSVSGWLAAFGHGR